LLTACYSNGKPNGQRYAVDPVRDYSYTFLRNLFQEVSNVFQDQYIHMGGDEVSFDCWQSNPTIQEFYEITQLE